MHYYSFYNLSPALMHPELDQTMIALYQHTQATRPAMRIINLIY